MLGSKNENIGKLLFQLINSLAITYLMVDEDVDQKGAAPSAAVVVVVIVIVGRLVAVGPSIS